MQFIIKANSANAHLGVNNSTAWYSITRPFVGRITQQNAILQEEKITQS